MKEAIVIENLSCSYELEEGEKPVLKNISFSVNEGEFVAILGKNGCGKSTLARHINGLIPVQRGRLSVDGLDVSDLSNLDAVRHSCGMVFQNPDNQFVSSSVREDIAFGPRNFGVPEERVQELVASALKTVGLSGFEDRSPFFLSGGQKQRLAVAGVLACEPKIIIFDEATSMLDPEGRAELLATMHRLHDAGRTILMISHYVEEAVNADRVLLMKDGQLLCEGTPPRVLTNRELMNEAGIDVPLAVRLYYDLKDRGIELPAAGLSRGGGYRTEGTEPWASRTGRQEREGKGNGNGYDAGDFRCPVTMDEFLEALCLQK